MHNTIIITYCVNISYITLITLTNIHILFFNSKYLIIFTCIYIHIAICDSCKFHKLEKSSFEILYEERSHGMFRSQNFIKKFIKLYYYYSLLVRSFEFCNLNENLNLMQKNSQNAVSVFSSQSAMSLHSVDLCSFTLRKFRRRANFARMDCWRELVREKFRMTESVACKFLFTGRYIFRDAMLANVSVCELPNNSYSTCVRVRMDDPSSDHLISHDLTIQLWQFWPNINHVASFVISLFCYTRIILKEKNYLFLFMKILYIFYFKIYYLLYINTITIK